MSMSMILVRKVAVVWTFLYFFPSGFFPFVFGSLVQT